MWSFTQHRSENACVTYNSQKIQINSSGKDSNLEMMALPLSLATDLLTGVEVEKAPKQ